MTLEIINEVVAHTINMITIINEVIIKIVASL